MILKASARLGFLVLLAAACGGRDARRHAARRWDTSQDHFQLKSTAVIAVTSAQYWPGGIESNQVRSFLDEFDIVADSLEARQYEVGVSFRDSIRVQQGTAIFDLRPRARVVPNDGYYFLTPGEQPRFVSGPRRHEDLLHAIRLWEEARSRAHDIVTPTIPAADTADHTVFLPLDSFPAVPLAVCTALQRRGCRIPQASNNPSRPNNIVHGHFIREDQTDWAAFCAIRDSLIVVIAWGGPSDCPDSLWDIWSAVHAGWFGIAVADRADPITQAVIRGIDTLSSDTLSLDHDAIGVDDMSPFRTFYYCAKGEWGAYSESND